MEGQEGSLLGVSFTALELAVPPSQERMWSAELAALVLLDRVAAMGAAALGASPPSAQFNSLSLALPVSHPAAPVDMVRPLFGPPTA
jgi:hypothetical protein